MFWSLQARVSNVPIIYTQWDMRLIGFLIDAPAGIRTLPDQKGAFEKRHGSKPGQDSDPLVLVVPTFQSPYAAVAVPDSV